MSPKPSVFATSQDDLKATLHDVAPWLETWVRLLDEQFRIPGTRIRFGFDPLLGLFLPVVGDALGALLACSLIFTAWSRGAPVTLLLQMLGNIALDTAVGSVPFVGDFIDIGLRANRRNLELLRKLSSGDETLRGTAPAQVNSTLRGLRPTKKGWLLLVSLLVLVLVLAAIPLALFAWLLAHFMHR